MSSAPTPPPPWWALPGLVLGGLVGVALSVDVAHRAILDDRWVLLGRVAVWLVVWAATVWCALRVPARLAVLAILGLAALLRVAALSERPSTSDDLYRYAWDARAQRAGVGPYRHPPLAPELAQLRDRWLWPDPADCAEIHRVPGCTRLNRPDARTIYPPVSQAWFRAVGTVAGSGGQERAWQIAAGLIDLLLCGLLVLALRVFGRDPRLVALYALCPIVVLEMVNNAHVDGLAVLFVVAALVAHRRERSVAAGALLGLAAMVKLYPAVILPALWRKRPAAVTASFVAVCAAAYLPHVISVGWEVLGYLPGYLREEHYDSGGRFLLLGLTGLSGLPVMLLAAVVLAGVTAWVVGRPGDRRWPLVRRASGDTSVVAGATLLFGALLLVATPVQPWYAVGLFALATLAGRPWWLAVALAGEVAYFAVILDHPHDTLLGSVAYAVAAATIAAAWFIGVGRRGPQNERPVGEGGSDIRREPSVSVTAHDRA